MPGKAWGFSTDGRWVEARRLVVEKGVSYEDAAASVGVSLSTLQKRAAKEGWQGQRGALDSYESTAKALKVALLERVRASVEAGEDANKIAQLLFAWQKAEAAFPELRRAADIPAGVLMEVAMGVLKLVVSYLEAHDRNALTAVGPHLRPLGELIEEQYGGR